jgi:hypothetical protein
MEAAAKSHEIMARFRPIAPKPPPPPLTPFTGSSSGVRKRGRHEDYYYIPPPSHLPAPVSWPTGVGSAAWPATKGNGWSSLPKRHQGPLLVPIPARDAQLVRLTLAVPGGGASSLEPPPDAHQGVVIVPQERDLLSMLQARNKGIIAPHVVRPLCTNVCIDSSNIVGPRSVAAAVAMSKKTAREVEAEIERDVWPAIVSDPHDRVLLVNDAYKAMVGQPVCVWLDALPGTGTSRRINGEVVLNVQNFSPGSRLPNDGGAFPCTSRISWELDGAIASLTVPCIVERLIGNSGNYRSIWRFDSTRASIIYCLA